MVIKTFLTDLVGVESAPGSFTIGIGDNVLIVITIGITLLFIYGMAELAFRFYKEKRKTKD